MSLTAAQDSISTLRELRVAHGFRAKTLMPDLAFVGLIDDTIDAAETAIELLGTTRSYRAYSMVRIAFEATQRLLVLATATDYVRLGTRAWLYYRRKDAGLRREEPSALGQSELQILDTWADHLPSSREIVEQELSGLNVQRGPDNFLGRNLAEVVTQAYRVFAAEKGSTVPPEATETNRAVYSALSRDAHACMRLEPQGLRIDADGFVQVVERPRNPAEVTEAVTLAIETTLAEAAAAVRFRLSRRQEENATQLVATLPAQGSTLPSGYVPDLGRFLLEQGLGGAESVFPDVPIVHIRELPDGTLSCSLKAGAGAQARMATFDFKGPLRAALLDTVTQRFPALARARLSSSPIRLDLPTPLLATITAVLGNVQQNDKEAFVPFIVTKLKCQEWRPN